MKNREVICTGDVTGGEEEIQGIHEDGRKKVSIHGEKVRTNASRKTY